MEEKILEIATELFLNYGFKSVTMDDIANKLGISKKTIYIHYPNKTDLVKASVFYMLENISKEIKKIKAQGKNPVEEMFDIKNFFMQHLKDEKSSPQFQLEKYYPKIFKDIKQKHYCKMEESLTENIERGIKMELYRNNLDVEFIIKVHYYGNLALKDQSIFPLKNRSMRTLMDYYLEYHLRGICTPKGIDVLNEQLKKQSTTT